LARVQELAVRLLFSGALLERYRTDPGGLLAELHIAERDAQLLPRIDDDAFRAEVRGRRLMLARGLAEVFEKTATHLAGERIRPDEWLGMPFFSLFLASDWFFEPRFGLPHPSGIGPGYEMSSKFFGWLVETYDLASPSGDGELRALAYHDFGLYLLAQRDHAHDAWYGRLAEGIAFQGDLEPGAPVVQIRVDPATRRLKTSIDDTRSPGIGDLDEIATHQQERRRQHEGHRSAKSAPDL